VTCSVLEVIAQDDFTEADLSELRRLLDSWHLGECGGQEPEHPYG